MQNEKYMQKINAKWKRPLLKIEPETTTRDEENLQSEKKYQNNRNLKNDYGYYQLGRYGQYSKWQYNNRQQR